ncbi:arginine utilization protein RocB [Alkalibacillus filiformis]|uniref:Arginine utilization protein RocB n=1 Tax=Alkalibacillus filiformis TaxID=200990 RepID=A0ABU0DRI4_9BACI|nr:M20/M25/M40 family metallo-hydrolase [Alkalibacillus filiformis]MDQ0350923.1 arginine utilization protein RocB [Alkalibacillus filiformis]
MKWQSKQQLTDLLCQLVRFNSITGQEDERNIVTYIQSLLAKEDYFSQNPNHLNVHHLDDGRGVLTALVKNGDAQDTVVLLSHIDVVDVEDYGAYKDYAFDPTYLTHLFKEQSQMLPEEAQRDLENGDWLFGRGTMDMKAGTALHLSMIEKAIHGEWDGNILLLVVPDEEVNSLGMLKATEVLKDIQEEENLQYKLCLNSEPMFRQYPEDENMYLYTGSLGKVLPGFLCYGKETHVGEPFHGLNANLMISYLNKNLELNDELVEKVGKEVTPPPVSLMSRDLKEHYSVQTPVTAVSMYNILFMKQTVTDITEKLYEVMEQTKNEVENHLKNQYEKFKEQAGQFEQGPSLDISILSYEQLYNEAVNKYGQEEVDKRRSKLLSERQTGDRDFSTILVQDLAYMCSHLAPMIVLFYSPPFYPAVTSEQNTMIKRLVKSIEEKMKSEGANPITLSYFNGISDLSFVGETTSSEADFDQLSMNLPMQQFQGNYIPKQKWAIPTLNVGPLGKDAHQWSERLELIYSFEKLPTIIDHTIHETFKRII